MDIAGRMDRIRAAIARLARLDPNGSIFGASRHQWRLEPPYTRDEVAALERSLGAKLPVEYVAFVTTLGRSGAGPYYGLEVPRVVGAEDSVDPDGRPSEPFPFAKRAGARAALPPGARRYDGVVYVATQGCGDFSVLVVTGERAGSVWSDSGHGGGPLAPEAKSFLAFYEAWIDRASLEWATESLAKVARERGPDDPPHDGVEAVRPLLSSAKQKKTPEPLRMRGWLAVVDRDFERAIAHADQAAAMGKDEPERRRRFDRALVRHVQRDWVGVLEEVEAGLAVKGWYATEDQLRAEKIVALTALGRRADAADALEARVASTYFTAGPFHELARRCFEDDDVARAERALRLAVERGAGSADRHARVVASGAPDPPGHPSMLPLADRVDDVFAPLIAALDHDQRPGDLERAMRIRATILGGE